VRASGDGSDVFAGFLSIFAELMDSSVVSTVGSAETGMAAPEIMRGAADSGISHEIIEESGNSRFHARIGAPIMAGMKRRNAP
jgi:hypothetical protein